MHSIWPDVSFLVIENHARSNAPKQVSQTGLGKVPSTLLLTLEQQDAGKVGVATPTFSPSLHEFSTINKSRHTQLTISKRKAAVWEQSKPFRLNVRAGSGVLLSVTNFVSIVI